MTKTGRFLLRCVAALVLLVSVLREVKGQREGFFLQELIQKYGSGSGLNVSQVTDLMRAVHKGHAVQGRIHEAPHRHHSTNNDLGECSNLTSADCLKNKRSRFSLAWCVPIIMLGTHQARNSSDLQNRQHKMCMDSAAIFSFHSLPVNYVANSSEVALLSPTVLYQLQNTDCYQHNQQSTDSTKRSKPTPAQTWGYGVLAVTIINICAALGVLFYPVMRSPIYKKILMAMVGLAVGSLSASAVLVLIPEALELMEEENPMKDRYVWRMLIVIGGIYLFFTMERMLEAVVASRRKSAERKAVQEKGLDNPAFEGAGEADTENSHTNSGDSHAVEPPSRPLRWAPLSSIKPVAWMVVWGDALHNFVDGVSIGAAFSADLLAGISLSLAVVCEELPHELGDFAVLLSSGMGLWQALLMNVASGMTCYLGLAVGIQVGELENGAVYIFAVAAGMFLYISLVDMLPEMNAQAREAESEGGSVCTVYLLQNLGLLVGWGIILLLVLYSDKISFGGDGS